MQSELLPSACMVELPSNPQLGISARVGGCSNCLMRVFPRRLGTGCFPSSQMYSSLYFVISIWTGGWDDCHARLERNPPCLRMLSRSSILYERTPLRKSHVHQLSLWRAFKKSIGSLV